MYGDRLFSTSSRIANLEMSSSEPFGNFGISGALSIGSTAHKYAVATHRGTQLKDLLYVDLKDLLCVELEPFNLTSAVTRGIKWTGFFPPNTY